MLLQQVVARDPNYDNGAAKADLAIARKNLVPVQIKRLQIKADTAHHDGQWSEEIASWKKYWVLMLIIKMQGNDYQLLNRISEPKASISAQLHL